MAYALLETGDKILLEDGSGDILLDVIEVDWIRQERHHGIDGSTVNPDPIRLTGISTNARSSGAVTSLTWSHTSNGDPLLVFVAGNNTDTSPMAVTFNGVAMTKGGSLEPASQWIFEWFYIQAPGSVTGNVVVTPGASEWISGGAFNVHNANFLTASSGFVAASGSSTTPSVTVASSPYSFVIDLVASDVANQRFNNGPYQSLTHTEVDSTTNVKTASSFKAGAASTTMSWNLSASDVWGLAALSIDNVNVLAGLRTSQVAPEIFDSGSKQVRVSQLASELYSSGKKQVRVSQLAIEIFTPAQASSIRVSQLAPEIFGRGTQQTRVSQLAIEIFTRRPIVGFSVYINGILVEIDYDWEIVETLNGIYTFTCNIKSARPLGVSPPPPYRPPLDGIVEVFENGTLIFSGPIMTVEEVGVDMGTYMPISTRVEASDFTVMTDRRVAWGTIPSDTLHNVLDYIVTTFLQPAFGITLDPAQATGPTMPDIDLGYVTLREALDAITQGVDAGGNPVNYNWSIGYNKRLRAYAPGDISAPINITDATMEDFGPFTSGQSRSSGFSYANTIWCRYWSPVQNAVNYLNLFPRPPATPGNFSDGDTITIGSRTVTFRTSSPGTDEVLIGADGVESLNNLRQVFDNNPDFTGFVNDTLTRLECFAIPVGSAGNSIPVNSSTSVAQWLYSTNFQNGKDAALDQVFFIDDPTEVLAHGLWEAVISVPNQGDGLAVATDLATAYLSRHAITPTDVGYSTFSSDGIHPGQVQTVTIALRDVNDIFIITEVTIRGEADGIITRRAKATLASVFIDNWQKLYKKWSGQ